MGMNPRLLRPLASGVHPEAAAWRSAVVSNGGSVSASTMRAVSQFCADIDAAGIRDRFGRLNLFCGTGLNACLVPLYRSYTPLGTVIGLSVDQSLGSPSFAEEDYVETGISGGLNNGASKHLNTGFDVTDHADARHLSAFICDPHLTTNRGFVGSDNFPDAGNYLNAIRTGGSGTNTLGHFVFSTTVVSANDLNTTGMHVLGVAVASGGPHVLYRNAVSVGSGNSVARTRVSGIPYYVFANNRKNVAGDNAQVRMGSYSIGDGMTQTQATAFYDAMLAFQNALGRKTT